MQTAGEVLKGMSVEERNVYFRRLSISSLIRLKHDYETFTAIDTVNQFKTYVDQQIMEGKGDADIADKVVSLSGHRCSSTCGTRSIVD